PQGRLGSVQTNPPYVNPFGTPNSACSTNYNCTVADNPHSADGFKACNGWNHVVTVWRASATIDTKPTGGAGHAFRWKYASRNSDPRRGPRHAGFDPLAFGRAHAPAVSGRRVRGPAFRR